MTHRANSHSPPGTLDTGERGATDSRPPSARTLAVEAGESHRLRTSIGRVMKLAYHS